MHRGGRGSTGLGSFPKFCPFFSTPSLDLIFENDPQQVSSQRRANRVKSGHGTTKGRLDGALWELSFEQHPAGETLLT